MPSTTSKDVRALSIKGPEALIDQLATLQIDGLQLSRPVPSQSPADILDSPMGGRKILAILKIVTALLSTGTATVKLAEEVEKFLHENPGQKVIVRSPQSGKILAQFDEHASGQAIRETFAS